MNKFIASNNKLIGIITIFTLKIILGILFSSDYQNKLFFPFIDHYVHNFDNPWQYVYDYHLAAEFPYPPLMLFIISGFLLPFFDLIRNNQLFLNLFFMLPTLIADLVITLLLIKLFPKKNKEILLFYCISPVIIYSVYMHSQLDLIPTMFLFSSIYLLIRNKIIFSSIIYGLALSTKFHVIAALPLLAIYIYKNQGLSRTILFLEIPLLIYLVFSFPYLLSSGYFAMVLNNPKQSMIYDASYGIDYLKIYLPVLVSVILYARFFAYRKINMDLFFSFLGLLFAVFVLLVVPSPGWYVWLFPFISIYFIKNYQSNKEQGLLYWALAGSYIAYVIFFRQDTLKDLIFINQLVDLKIHNEKLINISFTLLEASLLSVIFAFYKFGIKSNQVYKREKSLVIGLAGDSGVGKSTILSDIKQIFGDKLLEIEGDGDHRWERGDKNWDHLTPLNPKANFLHKQVEDIIALKAGEDVYRVEYDHNIGKFTPSKKIIPKDFIALSGLHTFYLPKMRKTIDLKIFIDTEEKLRRHWKILRDMEERKYNKGVVIKQILKRMKDSRKHILGQKSFADLIVNYSSDDLRKIGQKDSEYTLKLKLTFDSGVHIEQIVLFLKEKGVRIFWDYLDDLKNQYVILHGQVKKELIEDAARRFIPNIDDLISNDSGFEDDYRGFIQLVICCLLSDKMRELD